MCDTAIILAEDVLRQHIHSISDIKKTLVNTREWEKPSTAIDTTHPSGSRRKRIFSYATRLQIKRKREGA